MGQIITAVATPVITASSAYASGNALGGMLTFKYAANGCASTLRSAQIIDNSNQKAAIDIVLFNQVFTPTTDKSAIAISTADAANCVGVINMPAANYSTIGTPAVGTVTNVWLAVNSQDNNIYGQLVCRGTPTYTSTSALIVKLEFELMMDVSTQ